MNTELPVNNILYKEQSYWDERFEAEDTYEWFAGFEKFKSLVDSALSSKDSRAQVLMLGELLKKGKNNKQIKVFPETKTNPLIPPASSMPPPTLDP